MTSVVFIVAWGMLLAMLVVIWLTANLTSKGVSAAFSRAELYETRSGVVITLFLAAIGLRLLELVVYLLVLAFCVLLIGLLAIPVLGVDGATILIQIVLISGTIFGSSMRILSVSRRRHL